MCSLKGRAHCEAASFTVAHIQATMEDPGISTAGFGMPRVKFFELRMFLFFPLLFKDYKIKVKKPPNNPKPNLWVQIGIIADSFPVTRIYGILKRK